jgi:LacI family transcriptional regulator
VEVLLDRSVDGIIVAAAEHNVSGELFKKLQSHKIPYVLIDRLPSGFEGHFVGVKDEEIGLMATEHLIEQGCHRIAHLRRPANSTGIGPLRGHRRTLTKHGLEAKPEYVASGQHEDSTGYEGCGSCSAFRRSPAEFSVTTIRWLRARSRRFWERG